MSKNTSLILSSLLLVLPFFSDAYAATYKCIDENGDVTYSQIPCKKNQTTDKKMQSSKKPKAVDDCKYAGAFSKMTFRHMRSGLSSDQLFDRYGGVNSISNSTLGVINYVYSFKHSTEMQPGRVAQLTVARCNAQAFGDVSCEDFPAEFQEAIFSCDEEERAEAIRLQKMMNQSLGQRQQLGGNAPAIGAYGSNNAGSGNQASRKARDNEQQRIIECKQHYESEIRNIDDRMSRGYSASLGETLRDTRRSLVERLETDCR